MCQYAFKLCVFTLLCNFYLCELFLILDSIWLHDLVAVFIRVFVFFSHSHWHF